MRARPVRGRQHVGAARLAHREAHRVLDHARARTRRSARRRGRSAGRPRPPDVQRSGRSAPVCRLKVAAFDASQPVVGPPRLPELVEQAVHGIDEDDVAVAGAVALEVLERLPGLRQRLQVLVALQRPVLDRRVVGQRDRGRDRTRRDSRRSFTGTLLLVRRHDHEAHVEVVAEALRPAPMDAIMRAESGCTGSSEMSWFHGLSGGKTCSAARIASASGRVEEDGARDLRQRRPLARRARRRRRRRDRGHAATDAATVFDRFIARSFPPGPAGAPAAVRPSRPRATASTPASFGLAPAARQTGDPGAKPEVSCTS